MGNDDPRSAPPPKDIFSQIQDAATKNEIDPFRQKFNESQAQLQRGDAELAGQHAGTDPAYTSNNDHFEGMTHQQLYDAVHGLGGLDPKGLQTMRKTWFDCSSKLENLTTFTLQLGINNIFAGGIWQGAAADAGKAASDRFARVANQIGQVFDSISSRMDSAAWAAEAVRKAVPPPPNSVVLTPKSDDPNVAILPNLPNPKATDDTAQAVERARQDAIRQLNAIYTPSFPPTGANVPAYIEVPKAIAGDGGAPAPSGSGGGPAGGGSKPSGVEGNSGAAPHPEQQGSGQPGPADGRSGPSDPAPSETAPAASSAMDPAASGGAGPDATTAAGVGPDTRTGPSPSPGLGSPTSPLPGGHTGSGAGSSESRSGGPGMSALPQPGVSLPGGPKPGAQSGPATRGTAAAQGRPGQTGAGAPGAQGKRREDDREHRSPDYLKGVKPDWAEGLEAPPPVIGSDFGPVNDNNAYWDSTAPTAPSAESAQPSAKPARENSLYHDEFEPDKQSAPATEHVPKPEGTREKQYLDLSGEGPMTDDERRGGTPPR
ncbi:MAG: hypothetical protein J2P18_00160 [Nocardia sp.]|nr:hypothetical protein [Nocardia sp.]